MSKSRAPSTNKSSWSRHQSTIERLYVEERRSIDGPEGVMSYMERNYGFHANKSQYEYRISKWGKRKNIKKQQWCTVARILAQRSAEGKETEVRFQGNLISPERVARELARYANSTASQILPARPPSDRYVQANVWSGHESEELGDVTVATPFVPTEPEILPYDFTFMDVELYASTLQHEWPPPIVAAGNVSMLYSMAWMHPMCFPVRLEYQPFHWLPSLDWKMVSQLSSQSDLIKASTVRSDNMFYAPTTALQNFFDGSRAIAEFSRVIVTILNNLDQASDFNISRVHGWLGSLPLPTLRRFFKALSPPLQDVLRQQVFKAAMEREDEITVQAMLELGYDVHEKIFVGAMSVHDTVSPLHRALELRQFSLAKTIVTHLSQIEYELGLQDLLENIINGHNLQRLYLTSSRTFSRKKWADLMQIPLAKGANSTVGCFHLATCATLDLLFSRGNTLALLEEGLVEWALHDLDCHKRSGQYDLNFAMRRAKRIVTYLLGSGFKNVDKSTPELRFALSAAMEFALDFDRQEFWAVELIHLAGLQLQPPLASKTYTDTMKFAIDESCATGDWSHVHRMIDEPGDPPSPLPPDTHDDLYRRVLSADTRVGFDAAIAEEGDWRQYSSSVLQGVCNQALRFERDDVVIAVILTRPRFSRTEFASVLHGLLAYGQTLAVGMLVTLDEQFAGAVGKPGYHRDFSMLENLLYRSHTASGYDDYLPEIGRLNAPSRLQLVLRALSYHAIHTNDRGMMEWLMKNGLETNALRLLRSNTPGFLHLIAISNSSGFQTHSAPFGDYNFPSLLAVVAKRNCPEWIQILVTGGADPVDPDALRVAVGARADTSTIQMLLSAAGSGKRQQYGVGAMREAIRQKDHALVSLLAKHIDIHGMETDGTPNDHPCSPLGEAIRCHCKESAQLLINFGVQLEALVAWCGMNDSLLTRLTPMLAAVFVGDLQMFELLANAGAALDHGPRLGLLRTPLQSAAELGRFETVRFLLSKDVSVDSAPFYSGGTPLQLAAIGGFTGVAELLLEHGADVNHLPAEGDGRTAFEGAAEWGRVDMMTLLVRWGADLDLVSRPELLHTASSASIDSTRAYQAGYGDDNRRESCEVYGTQYERALVFAERRGEMASKRFVQHLRREISNEPPSFSCGTTFESS